MAKEKANKRSPQDNIEKYMEYYYRGTEFFNKHKKRFIYAGFAIIAIIALSVWYGTKQYQNNILASDEIGKVLPYFERGQFEIVVDGRPELGIKGLRTIVNEFGSTPAGNIAKLYLGSSLFTLGKYQESLEVFESASFSDKDIEASTLAGVGASFDALGKSLDAAGFFVKAGDKASQDSKKAEYYLHAGISFGQAGNKEMAQKYLNLVKTEYVSTVSASQVELYLAQYAP